MSMDIEDSRFWKYNEKGCYSVRDGYRAACDFFSPPNQQSERPIMKWWKFIWNLAIPPKIRIFWWCLSHDIIPTESNLRRHHVPTHGSCLLCGHHQDTTTHALFFCKVVKSAWKSTEFWKLISGSCKLDTLDFCYWIHHQLVREKFEHFATLTWGIWKMRMEATHGEGRRVLDSGLEWCSSFLCDFQDAAKKLQQPPIGNIIKSPSLWVAPPPGTLQMEVDVCINEKHGKYGIACVFRDNVGNKTCGAGKAIPAPKSVMEGELHAIQEGLSFALARGLRRFLVISDSLTSVQAVTEDEEDLHYTGVRISVIRKLMGLTKAIGINHVRRTANLVARNLARFASFSPSPLVWEFENFPTLMENDVN